MTYLDEALLDDPEHLSVCDTRGTVRALATAGAQVREAISLSAAGDRVWVGPAALDDRV